MEKSPYSSPLSFNILTWELSHSISSYLMCTCYVPDVIFLALWWYLVSITMSEYIRFDWFPGWKCQLERTIYERSEWMNEWMLKCCSPIYQEVSVLEHCYWLFSGQMHSVSSANTGPWLPRNQSYWSPWEVTINPAHQGDHCRLLVSH